MTKLNNFIVNVFATDDLDGVASAVLAHVYAKQHEGAVTIRCLDDEKANKELESLMRCVEDADARGDAIAKHIEIWAGNINILGRVSDELRYFRKTDGELVRRGLHFQKSSDIPYSNSTKFDTMSRSVMKFLNEVYAADQYDVDNDLAVLYELLDHDDFVDVISHMLVSNPYDFDISSDYTLNMFVKNYRKRQNSAPF